jgi:hypothetical protein
VYEYSYGTSLLRPLLLIQAYIDSFQRDMATIMAVYTKPMLVIKAGTPERPFTDPQREALQETFAKRDRQQTWLSEATSTLAACRA